jgi:hypothetical protein
MELKVRLNGEAEFTWTVTDEELDRFLETMPDLAAKEGGGQSAAELGASLLGLFAHGQLPPPQNETQALGMQRWVTYGILMGATDQAGVRVHDLLRHSDITCNITPGARDTVDLELQGTPRVAGTA